MMPDVTDARLDVALSDIERAGFGDEPDVVGGGAFGVIDESNWRVCEFEPAAGSQIESAPRLIVDRTCDEATDEPEAEEPVEEVEPEVTANAGAAEKPKRPKRRAKPEMFVMPSVVGENLQFAQDYLQSLGSYLMIQTDATGMGRFQVLDSGWDVCAQDPAPGVRTSVDTMVELFVVKSTEACP